MSASTIVYDLAGRPALVESVGALLSGPGVCALCGQHRQETADARRALGANFTDPKLFARVDTDRVCGPCLWCCSGKPPATLRMWTILAAPGEQLPAPDLTPPEGSSKPAPTPFVDAPGLRLTNRRDPRPVIAMLTDPPTGLWICSVAMSGQKHVLPYAQTNRGGGRWTVRMEATDVTSTPQEFAIVLRKAAALRDAGHREPDVHTGVPSMPALKTPDALDLWRALSQSLAPYTGSPLLALALWCLTKGTIPSHVSTYVD